MPRDITNREHQIGRRITQARLDAQMTQDELGDALGVTGATVSRWEKSLHQVHAAELARIADVLGKPVAWFYGEAEATLTGAFAYHVERLTPAERRLLELFAEALVRRQREESAS